MTSSDQLSPIVIGCVGLVGILLSFSAGRSRVGPNTVARLWRDILFTLSFSATLKTNFQENESYFKPIKIVQLFSFLLLIPNNYVLFKKKKKMHLLLLNYS